MNKAIRKESSMKLTIRQYDLQLCERLVGLGKRTLACPWQKQCYKMDTHPHSLGTELGAMIMM